MLTAVDEKTYDLRGLSTDGWPHGPNVSNWDGKTTISIANGSTLFLIDKIEAYMYSISTDTTTQKLIGTWVPMQ